MEERLGVWKAVAREGVWRWLVKVRLGTAFIWKRAAGRATLEVWAMVEARREVKTRVAAIVIVGGGMRGIGREI